ncbi:signal-regulatory protein beta-2-like [Stegastes partitus]|uniref:Signal-regulatory protein beta-2-like n=1 Tax=Stegastes partitus TaxID=144197 RepID=A0A9Y4N6M2_9TELE|nr:PREDICTED: signal-regulatory protein beta-2-like [Stegastes partitus]
MIVFFANIFTLWCLCAAQSNEVSQPVSLQTLKLGESATIQCYIKSLMTKRVWYKLTTGRKLQLVASFDSYYQRSVLSDEFERHYSVEFDKTNSHLRISATSWDDVGTYFCGVMHLNEINFGSGTFLMLKGAKMISNSVIWQPELHSVQSGDSVTLRCSIRSGQCAAEHISVMWLKNSDHSAPEMIHSSGNHNTCQTVSGETTCVYNLLIENLSDDDAGVYYCVVTSCGRILFGDGTRLIFDYDTEVYSDTPSYANLKIVIFLSISLAPFLALLVYICKTKCCYCTESCGGFSGSTTTSAKVQDERHLKTKASKSQRDDTWSECVYWSVKKDN